MSHSLVQSAFARLDKTLLVGVGETERGLIRV
jgi:hypothetical protein